MASFRVVQSFRHFSTSAVRHKLVNPPLKVHGIEGSYASALYSAASKNNKLDQVEKELNSFESLLNKDTKLREFLQDPSCKRKIKQEALASVLQKQKYSPITSNLLTALAENGRLKMADNVMKAFKEIMIAHRGEMVVTVTTAQPLDPANQKELKAAVSGFGKGQKMEIVLKVDPSLLGGMTVNIGGDRFVDMSTASKIKKYKAVLDESV